MDNGFDRYAEAAEYIKKLTGGAKLGVVLGSGLGDLAHSLDNAVRIPYADIPHFPESTAPSHEGALYCGDIEDKRVICMAGRFHYYEGYTLDEVTFYIRALRLAGVEKLILTNAAGGINRRFSAGTLMLISDHINFTGLSPLRGANDARIGERFPDMTDAYSREMRGAARRAAKRLGIELYEGVYAYMTGPSYETPAEIRALSALGADAVGMSTVPECVCAVHCGMRVLALSCVTNMAAGITGERLSEDEVIENAAKVHDSFSRLIREIIKEVNR